MNSTTNHINLNDLSMEDIRKVRSEGMDSVFLTVGRTSDFTLGHRDAEDMRNLRDSLNEFKEQAAKIIALAEQALAEGEAN
jgi:hypothetical protein